MAALYYWCVISAVLVSANLANADMEFYPDYSRPAREDLRFLENDRPSGSTASRETSMSKNSRQSQGAVGVAGGASESVADAPGIDIDESGAQRGAVFSVDPLSFVQRHSNDDSILDSRIYLEKLQQLNEMRRRKKEERRQLQQLQKDVLLRNMMAGPRAMFDQFQRELKNDHDRTQRMQARHRDQPNYQENSMEKPASYMPQFPDGQLYHFYADARLEDIIAPPSGRRPSGESPSLRDLTATADAELPDDDLSMDGPGDAPDASGDVQHVLQYYGGAVPAGMVPQVPHSPPLPLPEPSLPPAVASPAPVAPPVSSPRSKSRPQLYTSNTIQMEDGTVVKKVLRMPDHWFLGMPDVYKLAIVIGCSVMGATVVIGGLIWQYRLHRRAKAAADVDYPAYGVTGPSRDLSPSGDRRLAQSAQIYHYQHQKQQILSMEGGNQPASRGSMSEAESEDENEEGDYTVYECPGLAPPGEMEVKNPMFDDDPTTATPATPATPGSTSVGQIEGQTKSSSTSKGSPSSK